MRIRYYALWLSAVCIAVFILQVLFSGFTDLFVLEQASYMEIWRFLTAIFLHGSLGHLVANLFALALFGTILESLIGSRRFIKIFFLSGIIANIIAVNFYPSSLGASGAIYGVLGALIIIRPMMTVWVYSLPMPIFVAGALWVGNDIIGLFVPSNVGNIAHLSGITIGFIFGLFYRSWVEKIERHDKVKLHEENMRRWEEVYLK